MAVANRKEYDRQRLADRRQELVDLHGGKCIKCGSTENLEFHHRDPTCKIFTISKQLTSPWHILLAECSKCDLLCATCHRGTQHGTHWCYRKGCRCRLCTEENNRVSREYKRRRRLRRAGMI